MRPGVRLPWFVFAFRLAELFRKIWLAQSVAQRAEIAKRGEPTREGGPHQTSLPSDAIIIVNRVVLDPAVHSLRPRCRDAVQPCMPFEWEQCSQSLMNNRSPPIGGWLYFYMLEAIIYANNSAISRSSATTCRRNSRARPGRRRGSSRRSRTRASSARFFRSVASCSLGSGAFSNARHRSAFSRFQFGHFTLIEDRLGPLAYVEARCFDATPPIW